MTVDKQGNTRPVLRRRLFTVVALCIPVLFFLLLEAGLRLAGYGHSYPLFIPVAGAPGFLQANPDSVKRFVVDEFATPDIRIHPTRFPAQKAPGTLRIVVQGGSTAAGFPYGYGASLAGMLQQRLQATWPDINFEIITTAMPAVNSYTLLDFADEIIHRQPDAVLIYAGHNEYLGILGVGSALSAGRSRPVILALLALRESRLLQLLMHSYQVATSRQPVDVEAIRNSSGTLMHRIVGKRHIPLDSDLYREGEQQFRSNLASLLARYRDAGIPVFIGTLASNENGMAPFSSELAADTDAAVWQTKYTAGSEALQQGDLAAAEVALTEVVALDDTAASGYFALGQLLEHRGDYSPARDAYLAAKDRDQLRFRAPEAFNTVIRELAADYGAHVVEVQASLLEAAAHGIIGNDLMLEHLHPNLPGYFLLADVYFEALRERGVIGCWPITRTSGTVPVRHRSPYCSQTPISMKKPRRSGRAHSRCRHIDTGMPYACSGVRCSIPLSRWIISRPWHGPAMRFLTMCAQNKHWISDYSRMRSAPTTGVSISVGALRKRERGLAVCGIPG